MLCVVLKRLEVVVRIVQRAITGLRPDPALSQFAAFPHYGEVRPVQ
jgi:hypothetical protein